MPADFDPQYIPKFRKFILSFSNRFGRHDLPWRQDFDPYRILVSEIMLQQTQVERVIPKFNDFLSAFPSTQKLATAPIAEVIRHWQGLGYNRRGLNLQRAAQKIEGDFNGQVPTELDDLLSLPGIGPYTSAAIQAFAFNKTSLVIETNIRAVMLYHFFHGAYNVNDLEILDLVKATLDRENPRHWYGALMDYGTYLKQTFPNPTRRAKQYVKQSSFVGSRRQLRGQILRAITIKPARLADLQATLEFPADTISAVVMELIKEGFLELKNDRLQLAT